MQRRLESEHSICQLELAVILFLSLTKSGAVKPLLEPGRDFICQTLPWRLIAEA